MHRRHFLHAAAAASTLPGATNRKPNILFLLADQWRPQTLPSSGDTDLHAPHLGRIAREGVHFNRAYATNPVCSPSRASMITGLWPQAVNMPRNDLQLPLDTPSVAQQLKDAGYKTGYIGKWHLDGEERPGFVPPGPRRRGFDYWAAFNRGHFYYKSTYWRDSPEPILETGFEPDYQTGLAIDFIRANKANPFYLFLSWGPPHTPRTPPKHARLYDPRQFKLAPNVPAEYADKAREGMAGYYGLCSALDDNIGRLLKTLDEESLAEDTLVVFTADHGDMLGAHGLEYKGVHYEESVRIPLLMRYPRKLRPNTTSDLLISNADYMPTFVSLGGGEIPKAVQGTSLASQIFEGKGAEPNSLYASGKLGTPDEWRMVIRGLDKAVFDNKDRLTHLYNLGQDQFEQLNRAEETGYKRVRDELRAHLRHWRAKTAYTTDPSGLKLRK